MWDVIYPLYIDRSVHYRQPIRHSKPTKCKKYFLRHIYYNITLSILTCFHPQGTIMREITLIVLMWRIESAPNSIPVYLYIQQDAKLHSLFISGNCSTCFEWYFHPSSGAHTSSWYLSHRYCYLPLLWKSWNWFECAVGGVRHPQHTQTISLIHTKLLVSKTLESGIIFRYITRLWVKQPRDSGLIPGRSKILFSFLYSPKKPKGPRSLLSNGHAWLFLRVDRGRSVWLTSYLHLLSKLTL
jgi:hypothetical protein